METSASGEADRVLEKDYVILNPVRSPRHGWDKAFKRMADRGDDALMIPDVFADEDLEP